MLLKVSNIMFIRTINQSILLIINPKSYLILNFSKLLKQAILNKIINDVKNDNSTLIIFVIDLIWTLYDIYLLLIVKHFCIRLKTGHYGPMGVVPIYSDVSAFVYQGKTKWAIILETTGDKVKNIDINKNLQKGIIFKGNKKHNILMDKNKKVDYFKVFPIPLLDKKKRENAVMCDITQIFSRN